MGKNWNRTNELWHLNMLSRLELLVAVKLIYYFGEGLATSFFEDDYTQSLGILKEFLTCVLKEMGTESLLQ